MHLLHISSWPNVCIVNKRGSSLLKHMQFTPCFKWPLKLFCFKEVHNNYPTPMRWIITSLSLKNSGTATFFGLLPNAKVLIKVLLPFFVPQSNFPEIPTWSLPERIFLIWVGVFRFGFFFCMTHLSWVPTHRMTVLWPHHVSDCWYHRYIFDS